MAYVLGKRSLKSLRGVDPRLVKVVKRAIELTEQDFMVLEGVRSLERQRELVARGASKTLRSRHLTGDAVDLVVWSDGIDWDDLQGYRKIGKAMLAAAKEQGITLRWGADWDSDGDHYDETFVDWVHFELPRSVYG